jgi:hypothetical protein
MALPLIVPRDHHHLVGAVYGIELVAFVQVVKYFITKEFHSLSTVNKSRFLLIAIKLMFSACAKKAVVRIL